MKFLDKMYANNYLLSFTKEIIFKYILTKISIF